MSLEKSEVKKWVDENIESLQREYGVPHWRLVVVFSQDDTTDFAGECNAHPRYESAKITLNVALIDDLEDLERYIRHEICHIHHSPFEIVRWALNDALDQLPGMDSTKAALDSVFHTAMELTVKNLERMHNGHKEKYGSH
jgi:hypothetical protein